MFTTPMTRAEADQERLLFGHPQQVLHRDERAAQDGEPGHDGDDRDGLGVLRAVEQRHDRAIECRQAERQRRGDEEDVAHAVPRQPDDTFRIAAALDQQVGAESLGEHLGNVSACWTTLKLSE